MSWFSADTLAFLEDLRAHNDREWFAAHRDAYVSAVRDPARHFADALAQGLERMLDLPHAGKIYRINRDLRFSPDKTPYNAHVHITVWPRDTGAAGPAWMVGLEPGRLTFGAGIMGFSAAQLQTWRAAVAAGQAGSELADILTDLAEQGARLAPAELKRVPAPYGDGHPLADLLRRKSLTVWRDVDRPDVCFGEAGPGRCVAGLVVLKPVMLWLRRCLAEA